MTSLPKPGCDSLEVRRVHTRACPALLRSHIFNRCSVIKGDQGHWGLSTPWKAELQLLGREWAEGGAAGDEMASSGLIPEPMMVE